MTTAVQTKTFTRRIKAMASFLEVTIVHGDAQKANALLDECFALAERLIRPINAWDKGSELARVNASAGIAPVEISRELFGLLLRAKKICALTGGMFDITFASIDKVWFFDQPMHTLPEEKKIRASVEKINYETLLLDEKNSTAFITQKGTKAELGAIGKGYVVNQLKALLTARGIVSAVVNAGGDLCAWGNNEYGNTWKIGVVDPSDTAKTVGFLQVRDTAIATSGDYEKFAVINGKRYSHIIHPRTGWPVSGIKSVTIIYPDAELADALATSVFLLGVHEGLQLLNSIAHAAGFVIDDSNTFHYTENMKQQNFITA